MYSTSRTLKEPMSGEELAKRIKKVSGSLGLEYSDPKVDCSCVGYTASHTRVVLTLLPSTFFQKAEYLFRPKALLRLAIGPMEHYNGVLNICAWKGHHSAYLPKFQGRYSNIHGKSIRIETIVNRLVQEISRA